VDNFHRQVIESHHDFPSANFDQFYRLDDAVYIRRYSVLLEEIFVSNLPIDIVIEDILARNFFLILIYLFNFCKFLKLKQYFL
jgi:hypothetical protein